MTIDAAGVRDRLERAPIALLALAPEDRALVADAIATLDDADARGVAAAATALVDGLGCGDEEPRHPFASLPEGPGAPGRLAILALVATAADVVAWLRARGADEATASSGVADLGAQLRVHRRVVGVGGLDTQDWLALAWSGALLRHGALQVAHVRHPRLGWVRSVHIPAGASLDPDAIDASLAASALVGERLFPERATTTWHCRSWMLDPWLVDALPGTRLAAFAARWTHAGADVDGWEDVAYFVFGTRDATLDASALPHDSTLRRALAERMGRGSRPIVREGTLQA
ncbi:hypothetical protein GCM10009846_13300 [Agrococcus versicolor]|uniref:Uncharacterized protein n=1 Tax=Agrococcus versicolor TaxID=501482 RepID=A0ABN3AQF6_9MICO